MFDQVSALPYVVRFRSVSDCRALRKDSHFATAPSPIASRPVSDSRFFSSSLNMLLGFHVRSFLAPSPVEFFYEELVIDEKIHWTDDRVGSEEIRCFSSNSTAKNMSRPLNSQSGSSDTVHVAGQIVGHA